MTDAERTTVQQWVSELLDKIRQDIESLESRLSAREKRAIVVGDEVVDTKPNVLLGHDDQPYPDESD